MVYEKMEMNLDTEYKKAKIFFEQKLPVHVCLKSGNWLNGRIIEMPTIDFFFIHDREDGRILIFFHELIKPIVQYIPDEKNKMEER